MYEATLWFGKKTIINYCSISLIIIIIIVIIIITNAIKTAS